MSSGTRRPAAVIVRSMEASQPFEKLMIAFGGFLRCTISSRNAPRSRHASIGASMRFSGGTCTPNSAQAVSKARSRWRPGA